MRYGLRWRAVPILVVLMGMSFCVVSPESEDVVTVTGVLIRLYAIGGETPGWGLRLDAPIQLDGKKVRTLDVEPDGLRLDGLEGQRVEITGRLVRRQGLERGTYYVLVARRVRPLAAS